MKKNNTILSEKQINELSSKTRNKLLDVLYAIEDELCYNCKKVSNTINYLQEENRQDLCYEIYNDIYLDSFYGNHDETDQPACFDEFYNNEWQDNNCRNWYLSIYQQQNK